MTSTPRTFAGAVAVLALCFFGATNATAQLTINVGPDRVLCAGEGSARGEFRLLLRAMVSDGPHGPVSWSANGPGDVRFETDSGETYAVFPQRGRYTVRGEVQDGAIEASDDFNVDASTGAVLHWKLDEDSGRGVLDSAAAHHGSFDGGDASWLPGGGRYGGALRLDDPTGRIRLERDTHIGLLSPLSVSLWFKSDALQDGALIDRMPNRDEGTGWSLLMRADGALTLAVGNEEEHQTLTAEDAYSAGEWSHVAFTIRPSTSQKDSLIAQIFTLRESDEPAPDANIFNPLPVVSALGCFEDTELGDTDVHIHLGIPNDALDFAPTASVEYDDVRIFAHALSPVEVQDTRLRRAPWRVGLVGSGSGRPWIVGELQTLDPNLCDTFQYEIVDVPGSDAAAFQILGNGLLSTTDAFVTTVSRTYCVTVRSTDDVGFSVDTEFCITIIAEDPPLGPPVEPPVINVFPGTGGSSGVGSGDGVWVPVVDPPTTTDNPTVNIVVKEDAISPPPQGAVAPVVKLVRRLLKRDEDSDGGGMVANFEIEDVPESPYTDGFQISMAAGAGDADNGRYRFIAFPGLGELPSLWSNGRPDFATKPVHEIRIAVVDNLGNRFEHVFSIEEVAVRINEFAPSNSGELVDDLGANPDWIEIYNPGPNPLSLSNWGLTDEEAAGPKWYFPRDTIIESRSYMIVFASNRELGASAAGVYHADFKLSRERCEYLALSAHDDFPFSVYEHAPEIPSSLSYGLLDGEQVLMAKTPYRANALPTPPPEADLPAPEFDRGSGYFRSSITVGVTAPADAPDGSIVRFTTDGTEPDATSLEFTGQMSFSNSTILRARIYTADGAEGPVATQSYLSSDDIIADPDVDANSPGLIEPAVRFSLTQLPAVVIAGDPDWLFGDGGLSDPEAGRVARPASVELFDPSSTGDPAEFNTTAGIRLNGRRGLTDSPKQSFRIQFRTRFGNGTLRNQLFGTDEEERFDNLVLRAGFNNSFTHPDAAERARAQGVRDRFARDTHRAMGRKAARGRFVNLFLNDRYWGVYDLAELPDDRFAARGECFEDYLHDVIDAGQEADGGDRALDRWVELEILMLNLDTPPSAEQLEAFRALVDDEDLADFLVLHAYIGSKELGFFSANGTEQNNWFASRLAGAGEGFGFHVWDSERSLEEPETDYLVAPNRSRLIDVFAADPELKLLLADRLLFHTRTGGALDGLTAQSRYLAIAADYEPGIAAELARWGNKVDPTTPATASRWRAERSRIVSQFIPDRAAQVINTFRTASLFPDTDAPVFAIDSGFHPLGVLLSFDPPAPGEQIYMTIDGSDPRVEGGGISPNAIFVSGSFPLAGEHTINARVRSAGGEWSAMASERFAFGYSDIEPGALRVTELMPAPFGGNNGHSFVEFYNGGDRPIALGGLELTGDVEFDFSNAAFSFLEPGAYMVLVEQQDVFEDRYGTGIPIVGTYEKSLTSSLGKRVRVRDIEGRNLVDFTPQNGQPWPSILFNRGYSFVLDQAEAPLPGPDPNSPASWRLTSIQNGSPGRTDPPLDDRYGGVIINELRIGAPGSPTDAIELRNLSSGAVDISHWLLTRRQSHNIGYTFPEGTVIPGDSLFTVYADDDNDSSTTPPDDYFGQSFFPRINGGVVLTPGDASGQLYSGFDLAEFTLTVPGATRSRYTDSTGLVHFAATTDTIGSPNAPLVQEPIVVHEIWDSSPTNTYVELINRSDAPVDLASSTMRLGYGASAEPLSQIFGDVTIQPGGLMLAVGGSTVIGEVAEGIPVGFSNELSASRILLSDTTFSTNEVFDRDDERWPSSFLDGERSLVRGDLDGFANEPASWRVSCAARGTPGRLPILSFDEAMATGFPGGTPDQITTDADPDGDGFSNLIEIAFASDPGEPSGSPISTELLEGDVFQLSYRRPHDTFEGIDYILEVSTDLEVWEPMPEGDFTTENTPLANGTLSVIHAIAITPGGNEQFRVRIEM